MGDRIEASRANGASVESAGLDVHFRVYGAGTPLLVLGGGPGDVSDRYVSLCALLAGTCRCILVDQRGTGPSMPKAKDASTVTIALTLEDFEAVRKSLGIERWDVLGFSYGGFLASAYAEVYPASLRSLVLLDSSGLNQEYGAHFSDTIMSRLAPQDLMVYKYWEAPERLAADRRHAITEIIRAMMPGYFCDREKSLIVSQAIRDGDFDFETGALIDADIERRKLDLSSSPPAFSGPVLVLHGRQDPLGESVPLRLARHYRDARLVFVEKAGHYSWIEQPEKVREAIAAHLAAV